MLVAAASHDDWAVQALPDRSARAHYIRLPCRTRRRQVNQAELQSVSGTHKAISLPQRPKQSRIREKLEKQSRIRSSLLYTQKKEKVFRSPCSGTVSKLQDQVADLILGHQPRATILEDGPTFLAEEVFSSRPSSPVHDQPVATADDLTVIDNNGSLPGAGPVEPAMRSVQDFI